MHGTLLVICFTSTEDGKSPDFLIVVPYRREEFQYSRDCVWFRSEQSGYRVFASSLYVGRELHSHLYLPTS